MYVIYTGTNVALHAYGYRFEKDKPVEIKDKDVLKALEEREDFSVQKPATRRQKEGAADGPDTGSNQTEE